MYQEPNKHLNKKATDLITEFTGTVTAYCQYVTGCDQYLLTPKCKEDGTKPQSYWFNVNRLEFEDDGRPKLNTKKDKGPDIEAPNKG